MKILFILGMYKPKPSANGICSHKVMRAFVENGDSVTCIVNGERSSPDNEVIEEINVRRIKPRWSYRLREWSEGVDSGKHKKFILMLSKVMNKFKSLLMIGFWPLISLGYTFRFYKKAKSEYEKEKFDIVVSVYTPIDSLIAGHLLKRKYPDIKFVPYFLDSLSGGYGPKYFSAKRLITNGQKWEKRLLENADMIVAMKSSQLHHIKHNKESSYFDKIFFLDIPLVSKDKKFFGNSETLKETNINCMFIGTVPYPIRNPKYILELFEQVENDHINLIFVGDNNCSQIFEDAKKALGHKLLLLDQVSHDKAMKLMREADFLINLGNNISSMVPSKIFEYMSLGKPIISTYSIDDEPSIVYLNKYPAALLLDERNTDFAGAAKEVKEFINKNIDTQISYDYVEDIFKLNTPKAFVKEVEKISNLGGTND